MCSACSCVWRLSFVVDNYNVVATEHSRYGLSCTYVETIECMSMQCWVCIAC